MTVVHVTPTYFGVDSILGGGERYVTELAQAMARKVQTRLVSFGNRPRRERWGPLEVHIYKPLGFARGLRFNPISFSFLSSLRGADIVHCYQAGTLVTDLAIIQGCLLWKAIFLTDLGGSADFSLWYHLPLWRGIRSLLAISDFNRARFRNASLPTQVIYGGVDAARFCPGGEKNGGRLLHVGRILPHKGIHHLIDALPPGSGLDVIGPVSSGTYERQLREQAKDKDVVFYHQLSDGELILKYQTALATVLPALEDSGFTTVLESLACGTPVIVSSVGSLPEIVEEGIAGFLVPAHNPSALREKIEYLLSHPSISSKMGRRGREIVLKRFTWDAVAQRCLQAYPKKRR